MPVKNYSSAPWMKRPNPIQIGLTAIKPDQWLAKADTDILGQRQTLLDTHRQAVFAAETQSLEACAEAAELVRQHAKRPLRPKEPLVHPLLSVGGEIMEDCLILQRGEVDAQWRLTAAVLCFPAHWHLDEKMGQPLLNIHHPVPHYAEKLNHPVNRLFDHMEREKFSRRKNWTLQIGDRLHAPKRLSGHTDQHEPGLAPVLTPENVGEAIYCREEVQSFVKLPETEAILFTIQTKLSPLQKWQYDKEALLALIDELAALSPAMRTYRAVESYEKALIGWVHQQTAKQKK